MRRETAWIVRDIVALRELCLKHGLKRAESRHRLGRDPHRVAAGAVLERSHFAKLDRERRDMGQGRTQLLLDAVELFAWHKWIEQCDVRHPPRHMAVVSVADGLDRTPGLLGQPFAWTRPSRG